MGRGGLLLGGLPAPGHGGDEVGGILLAHSSDKGCLVMDHERVHTGCQHLERQIVVLSELHADIGRDSLEEGAGEEYHCLLAQQAAPGAGLAAGRRQGSGLIPGGPSVG